MNDLRFSILCNATSAQKKLLLLNKRQRVMVFPNMRFVSKKNVHMGEHTCHEFISLRLHLCSQEPVGLRLFHVLKPSAMGNPINANFFIWGNLFLHVHTYQWVSQLTHKSKYISWLEKFGWMNQPLSRRLLWS